MRLSLGSDLFRADLPEREIGKLGVNRLRQIRADIRIVVAPALQQFHERLMDNRPFEGGRRRSGRRHAPQWILPDAILGVVDVGNVQRAIRLDDHHTDRRCSQAKRFGWLSIANHFCCIGVALACRPREEVKYAQVKRVQLLGGERLQRLRQRTVVARQQNVHLCAILTGQRHQRRAIARRALHYPCDLPLNLRNLALWDTPRPIRAERAKKTPVRRRESGEVVSASERIGTGGLWRCLRFAAHAGWPPSSSGGQSRVASRTPAMISSHAKAVGAPSRTTVRPPTITSRMAWCVIAYTIFFA